MYRFPDQELNDEQLRNAPLPDLKAFCGIRQISDVGGKKMVLKRLFGQRDQDSGRNNIDDNPMSRNNNPRMNMRNNSNNDPNKDDNLDRVGGTRMRKGGCAITMDVSDIAKNNPQKKRSHSMDSMDFGFGGGNRPKKKAIPRNLLKRLNRKTKTSNARKRNNSRHLNDNNWDVFEDTPSFPATPRRMRKSRDDNFNSFSNPFRKNTRRNFGNKKKRGGFNSSGAFNRFRTPRKWGGNKNNNNANSFNSPMMQTNDNNNPRRNQSGNGNWNNNNNRNSNGNNNSNWGNRVGNSFQNRNNSQRGRKLAQRRDAFRSKRMSLGTEKMSMTPSPMKFFNRSGGRSNVRPVEFPSVNIMGNQRMTKDGFAIPGKPNNPQQMKMNMMRQQQMQMRMMQQKMIQMRKMQQMAMRNQNPNQIPTQMRQMNGQNLNQMKQNIVNMNKPQPMKPNVVVQNMVQQLKPNMNIMNQNANMIQQMKPNVMSNQNTNGIQQMKQNFVNPFLPSRPPVPIQQQQQKVNMIKQAMVLRPNIIHRPNLQQNIIIPNKVQVQPMVNVLRQIPIQQIRRVEQKQPVQQIQQMKVPIKIVVPSRVEEKRVTIPIPVPMKVNTVVVENVKKKVPKAVLFEIPVSVKKKKVKKPKLSRKRVSKKKKIKKKKIEIVKPVKKKAPKKVARPKDVFVFEPIVTETIDRTPLKPFSSNCSETPSQVHLKMRRKKSRQFRKRVSELKIENIEPPKLFQGKRPSNSRWTSFKGDVEIRNPYNGTPMRRHILYGKKKISVLSNVRRRKKNMFF